MLGYIKAPFAIAGRSQRALIAVSGHVSQCIHVAMGVLFFLSVLEGMIRVTIWSLRSMRHPMLKLQQLEHINTCFEVMMSLWYVPLVVFVAGFHAYWHAY